MESTLLETTERSVYGTDFSRFPDWKVKGSTLKSKVQFATEHFGEAAGQALDSWLAEAVGGTVLAAAWHPFEIYDRLLHELAGRFYGGRLIRLQKVGRHSAHHALTETYSIFAMQKDFARFLERISTLHSRFYNQSRLVVTEKGETFCRHQIEELPAVSEADVHVALGFYLGAAEVMGLQRVRGTHEVRDEHMVAFRIAWA